VKQNQLNKLDLATKTEKNVTEPLITAGETRIGRRQQKLIAQIF